MNEGDTFSPLWRLLIVEDEISLKKRDERYVRVWTEIPLR